jgi:hypothetical protein
MQFLIDSKKYWFTSTLLTGSQPQQNLCWELDFENKMLLRDLQAHNSFTVATLCLQP